jgi:hypothetical protein
MNVAVIHYLELAICPLGMMLDAAAGMWLLKLAAEPRRQFLRLVGLAMVGTALQALALETTSLTAAVPALATWLGDPSATVKLLDLGLSFGTTICFSWAGVLVLHGKLDEHESATFGIWIGGVLLLFAILLQIAPEQAWKLCQTADTVTSVFAGILMAASLVWLRRYMAGARTPNWLRRVGVGLWAIFALYQLPWYLIEADWFKGKVISDEQMLVINVFGVLSTFGAALITGEVGRRIMLTQLETPGLSGPKLQPTMPRRRVAATARHGVRTGPSSQAR